MDTKLILILLLIIFIVSPVSAKFICGGVVSLDNTTPAWYEVKTFLMTNPSYSSTCKVSPSNNRYCCDLDIIKDKTGYQWKTFDIFSVKITDKTSGYFASPKLIVLSGNGYDVAPVLTLQKAIKITQPNTTLTISENQIPIQLSIPNNCTNTITSQQNMTQGKNNITITTICNDEKFETSKIFYLLHDIEFKKIYPKKIRNKKSTTIKLQATLSNKIENIPLKEYVPSSWSITDISNNGNIEESTPQYNVITWQVTGNNFSFSYKAKAPKVGLFKPKQFTFKTILDKYNLEENQIKVYKFFPLPIKPSPYIGGWGYNPKIFSKVSEQFPLFFKNRGLTVALYSSKSIEQSSFDLLDFFYDGKFDRRYKYLKSYHIQTTLNSTEKGKMIIEYKTNKTFLKENNYKKIALFEKHKDKFIKITGAVIDSKDDIIQYRFETEKSPSEIYIFAEKNSLTILDKILNFLDRLKFW